MKPALRLTGLLIMLAGLSACGKQAEPLTAHRLFVFGTLVDITVYGASHEKADEAVRATEQRLQALHRQWHAWQPGNLVDINRQLASGQQVEMDHDSQSLIRQAMQLSRQSHGLFNPAAGKLIALWGFHSDTPPAGPPPSATDIATLLSSNPSMEDLQLSGNRLSSRNPALQLDFGAFAKGVAVNEAIELIKQHGIRHAIVNAGGDLRAIGQRGTRPWRIGIRHPSGTGVIASLETGPDESVFTSGVYERYFDYQGRRYHHILDPRSGEPARDTLSVTVVHSDAATADAAATALLIAGPARWQDIARQMGIEQAMLIDRDMRIHITPALAKRINIEPEPAPEVIITGMP